MTPEQIKDLAEMVGVYINTLDHPRPYIDKRLIETLALVVESHTRAECARVCRDMQNGFASDQHIECAEAIERMK